MSKANNPVFTDAFNDFIYKNDGSKKGLAVRSGVHYNTILKISKGDIPERTDIIAKLQKSGFDASKYLNRKSPISERQLSSCDTDDTFQYIYRLDLKASGKSDDLVFDESKSGKFALNRQWVRSIGLEQQYIFTVLYEDSDMEPSLSRGESVLIHGRAPYINEKIYLVRVGKDVSLWRLRLKNEDWVISKDHPSFKDMKVVGEDVVILGKAIAALKLL